MPSNDAFGAGQELAAAESGGQVPRHADIAVGTCNAMTCDTRLSLMTQTPHGPQPPHALHARNVAVYLQGDQQVAVQEIADALHMKFGGACRHLILLGLEVERRRLAALPAAREEVTAEAPLVDRILADPARVAVYPGRPRISRAETSAV